MTRKEAITWLNKLYARADITDEYGDMEDMQPYEEALNIAINSLEIDERYELEYEQVEPKTDVLDKIRAEIVEMRSRHNVGVMECLEIIDKYKVESEGEE